MIASSLSETTLASSNSIVGTFSREEVEALRCFMSNLDTSHSNPHSSFAQSGTSAFAFNASVSAPGHSWIID